MARKILLADDSVTAQNMGRKILSDAGYEVITVNNGSAALKKIAEHRPDLIVLDVYMPGYSGLEVCQRLKETQETARIPVLLTVGKLEPFKAEEAQRVRAEGFIVKPFEASELLSALTRLEDKVVPRPEPSKPGRFARAIAAVEEAGRAGQDDNGWKERLAFPGRKKKAEAAEPKPQDDAAIYNPVNRDLRTVVDKPAAEAKVDVSAAVPEGLPKDVTPEELAAIAAAVAQMQGTLTKAQEDERAVAEPYRPGAELPKPEEPAAAAPVEAESKVEARPVVAESAEELKAAVAPAEALAPETPASGSRESEAGIARGAAEEAEEVPATMAATSEMSAPASGQGPRWMAVPVALAEEESGILLEQEMQKAYAAFAAAEANRPGFVESAPETAPANTVAELVANAAEPQVAVASASEESERVSAPLVEAAPAFAVAEQPEAVAAPAEPVADQSHGQPEPVTSQVAPTETHPAGVAAPASETRFEPQRVEAPADFAVVAAPEAVVTNPADTTPPAAETQAAMAAAASADTSMESAAPQPADADTVASTAAAWASWRQIRDAGPTKVQAEASPAEFETNPPATHAEPAAMAVAAGAEQIAQEVSAAATSSNENPSDVASIVESVLADLRPRLMEEISKKLSSGKK